MGDDVSQLDELVANLRRLDAAGVEIATTALPEVLADAKATAAAGASPEGQAWTPTKEGRPALPNAASAITAVVSGASKALITLVLAGPYTYHHASKNKSAKKGLPRRPILFNPDDGVPVRMAAAIGRAASRVVARTMGGR